MELLEKYRTELKPVWLGELYNRYSHLVFGLCLKYLKDEENARDAVLAIFEKLITDLKTREVATFQHWLYAVSRNYCLEVLRSRGREEKRRYVYHSENNVNMLEESEVISLAELKEAGLKRLEQAISRLNNDQRQCVEMFYIEEKSYKEITETTGYTLGEVKSHLQNGRRNLRILLATNK
ncbi:MAG: RNA polymerase sigma factor [Flavobacteriales bacterium]|nr:RNA polymerase sigma factor [Flavobacteriales bacterium]